jgi:hypothetical protein
MSEHAHELEPEEIQVLGNLVTDAAERREVTYLTQSGRRVAAIVPLDVAAAGEAAVEALEDAALVAMADAAINEPGENIPAEELYRSLGI